MHQNAPNRPPRNRVMTIFTFALLGIFAYALWSGPPVTAVPGTVTVANHAIPVRYDVSPFAAAVGVIATGLMLLAFAVVVGAMALYLWRLGRPAQPQVGRSQADPRPHGQPVRQQTAQSRPQRRHTLRTDEAGRFYGAYEGEDLTSIGPAHNWEPAPRRLNRNRPPRH